MLEVNGLNVRYGSVEALRDVSIRVGAGSLVAILGANGAGKSTLLRAISGIARAASGTIVLGGKTISGLRPEEIVRRGVAHVPEGRGIFPDLTVSENLMMGAYARRGQKISADYSRVLAMFSTGGAPRAPVRLHAVRRRTAARRKCFMPMSSALGWRRSSSNRSSPSSKRCVGGNHRSRRGTECEARDEIRRLPLCAQIRARGDGRTARRI